MTERWLTAAQVDVTLRTPLEEQLQKHMPKAASSDSAASIVSPMAGKLVSLNVQRGDKVKEGQIVCVLEAMKMQNNLKAARNGIVKAVHSEARSWDPSALH